MSNSDESKIITVRGVNAEIYDSFRETIKSLGLNMGDAVNKMMAGVIEESENIPKSAGKSLTSEFNKIVVSDQTKLIVSKQDLTETEGIVYFQAISTLKFEQDVDLETFLSKIIAIKACHKVILPRYDIPRLELLSKIKFCENLEFYDIDQ